MSDEHLYRPALALEVGLRHIAEILSVHVHRHGRVASDLDYVEIVAAEDSLPPGATAEQRPRHDERKRAGAHGNRGHHIEAKLEAGVRDEMKRERAGVGIGIAVGYEREGRTPQAFDLEGRHVTAGMGGKLARHQPRDHQVAGKPPVMGPPSLLDPPDELGVEAQTGGEGEAAAVHPPERDRSRVSGFERKPDPAGGRDRIAGQPERTREDVRAASGNEPNRHRPVEAVEDLVEDPVSGEDEHRLVSAARLARELDRMVAPAGLDRLDPCVGGKRFLDGLQPRLGDAARERVDDQRCCHHLVSMPARRVFLIVPFVLLAAGCFGGGDEEKSKAVAHVGRAAITREHLDETVDHFKEEAEKEGREFPERGSARYRTVERQALGLMVYRAELVQTAARLGAPVTDAEVEERTKAAGGEAEEKEAGRFAGDTIRAQLAYEHLYRKVTSSVPAQRRGAAMARFLFKMKRGYRVSYEPGFRPAH